MGTMGTTMSLTLFNILPVRRTKSIVPINEMVSNLIACYSNRRTCSLQISLDCSIEMLFMNWILRSSIRQGRFS
jgi:hypothetical protein